MLLLLELQFRAELAHRFPETPGLQLLVHRNAEKPMCHVVRIGVRPDYRSSGIDTLCMAGNRSREINGFVSFSSLQKSVKHSRCICEVTADVVCRLEVRSLRQRTVRHVESFEVTILQ